MTVLDLPSRWDELEDSTRLRLLFEDGAETEDGRPAISALRLREAPVRAGADQCDLATAEALARRLAPLHVVTAGVEAEPASAGEITGPSDFMDLLGLGDVHALRPRDAPGARVRRATGCGCRSGSATAAARSTSTSRSPPSRAWARTAW